MRHVPRIALALLAATCAWSVQGRYMQPDLEQIPVERLVANLEKLVAESSKDAQLLVNLARIHGMAYAQKTDTVTIRKSREKEGAWFGHEPANVPFRPKPTTDPALLASAKSHLAKAIARYQEAIAIDSDHLVARIGLAWCTEQSGDTPAAIAAYRDVIARAWAKEGQARFADVGWKPVTAESAGYLIPLLDPAKDAAEIATLRSRIDRLNRIPRPITPVAVPLRDGLALADIVDDDAAVRFDADGSGLRKPWTWITPDAGWLVYDQLGRGEIRSALQLFGSVSFWMFWDTGYDAMRALDNDRDGRLAGAELRHLGLWRDANRNGLSERGEVRPLAAYDIVSMSYDFVRADDADKTAYSPRGVTFKDGTTRPTWDAVLQPAR